MSANYFRKSLPRHETCFDDLISSYDMLRLIYRKKTKKVLINRYIMILEFEKEKFFASENVPVYSIGYFSNTRSRFVYT